MAALCGTRKELQLCGVVQSMALCTETHDADTLSVETSDTSSVETSDTSSVEILDTSSVEAQDTASVETLAEPLFGRVAHNMAYCEETRDVLLCDSYHWTIEHVSLSSSSGMSLQRKKLLKLDELYGISHPLSVQIARKMRSIFIGCGDNEGIYVLDRNSLQLVKKFAQNMNRDFDYMVVDETEYPECCTVYASSVNNCTLMKFDYSSGSVMRELSVKFPNNILLKDNKLYLICEMKYILVIDKHSLEIQSKLALSGWSFVGGLCLDKRSNVCVTARNESNHRILYSFDDGFNEVSRVQLEEFDEYAFVLDMVAADKDFIMLTQELGWQFTMKRIRMKF